MVLVSFCLVTYNHEKYIYQTLQSIIEAPFDFDFEIIIGNDKSTDATKNEISRFVKDYPDYNVTVINRPTNIGVVNNWFDILGMAKGKYYLCIDGDDYIEFSGPKIKIGALLRQSETCLIFSHKILYEDTNTVEVKKVADLSFEQSLDGVFFHFGSVFMPVSIVKQLLKYDWLKQYNFLDRPLQTDIIRYKNKRFISDTCMSVYRKHGKSESFSMTNLAILNTVTSYLFDYYKQVKGSLKVSEKEILEQRISRNYLLSCNPRFLKNISSLVDKYGADFKKVRSNTSLLFAFSLFAKTTFSYSLKRINLLLR